MLSGSFCTPDDACGGTGGIKTSVWTVTFMGSTELTMGLGTLL